MSTSVDDRLLYHAPTTDDRTWRESLYFNLGDPAAGIGVWIYFWVFPNQDVSHSLVTLYKGRWPKPILTRNSRKGPWSFTESEDGIDWLFSAHCAGDNSYGANFDRISLGGLDLEITRTPSGHEHHVRYGDDAGNHLDLRLATRDPLWLYSAAGHGCPQWLSADRYHQAVVGGGSGELGGRAFELTGVGDTDHSWGMRDYRRMAATVYDYWAYSSPDATEQLSLFRFGEDTGTLVLGQVTVGGRTAEVTGVSHEMAYDDQGLPDGGSVAVTDELGRVTEMTLTPSYAAVGYGDTEKNWAGGYESVTTYTVGSRELDGLYAYTRLGI